MSASTSPTERNWLNTENLEIIMDIWQFFLSGTEIIVDILMFVCSVYLILSYSVPAFSSPEIVTNALAVMVAAPELLLAGAFIKSSKLRREGNSKGWPLTIICWSFLLLTIVTVGSLVYQLDSNTAKIITVARCGLGIAYGLLSIIAYREAKEKREQEIALVQSIPELFAPYLQQLQQSNQQLLDQMRQENQTALQQIRQSNQTASASLVASALKDIDQSNQTTQSTLTSLIELRTNDLNQTVHTALDEALHRLEESSTARTNKGLESLMAGLQRTVSITVEPSTNPTMKAVSQRAESLNGLTNQTASREKQTGDVSANQTANQTGSLPKDLKNQTTDQTGQSMFQAALSGGASERAEAYILDCLSKEIRPSITDVMAGASVSRDTAIKTRNKLGLGTKA